MADNIKSGFLVSNETSFNLTNLPALRKLPPPSRYKAGDVLVVFGELFARGYANGIVDEAERHGLKVIRSTVGRREVDGSLRPLNSEELKQQKPPFINIPLEAGFDLEPSHPGGPTPNSFFEGVKLGEWQNAKADFTAIEKSRLQGRERFRTALKSYVKELQKHIEPGKNVIFCHTMAGGVPRTKIIMPVMNRVFKGTGDRHVASSQLFESDLGRFALMNFDEVSAETFRALIEETTDLRATIEKNGGSTRFLAYGYHGTEVLVGDDADAKFEWQTYTPYFQGWAKMRLENYALHFANQGVRVCVYNCPEILTNSSSIFLGVEVSLYPLLGALARAKSSATPNGKSRIDTVLNDCRALLKPEHDFQSIMKFTQSYIQSELIRSHSVFAKWPQNNSQSQMETMLNASEHLFQQHLDEKNLMTNVLSEQVFRATGHVMFHDSFNCEKPVVWLGHDVLAAALASGNTL